MLSSLDNIDKRFKNIDYTIKKEEYFIIAKSIALTTDLKILYSIVIPQTIVYRNKKEFFHKMKERPIMNKLLNIGYDNRVPIQQIEGIINYNSAPSKRLVQKLKEKNKVIDATEGRKTRSVIITTQDIIILSAFAAKTLQCRDPYQENMFLSIGYGNVVLKSHILSILDSNSSPIKRLVSTNSELDRTYDVTQGRSTHTIIVTISNKTFKSSVNVKTLEKKFNIQKNIKSLE